MGKTHGRDIDLGPTTQEPDEHGVRKYARDAVQRMRNTGYQSYVEEALREDTMTHDEAVYLRAALTAKTAADTAGKTPGGDHEDGGKGHDEGAREARRSDS